MLRFDWFHLTLVVLLAAACWRLVRMRRTLREEQDANSNLRNLVREMQGERRR